MRHRFLLLLAVFAAASTHAQESRESADLKLAINLYNDRLYDLALEQFQQFVNRYPQSPQVVEARFYLGLAQARMGRHDDARFTFQNFALSYPDNPRAPEAWWNVAEANVELGNFRDAAVSFERIQVFHPKSRQAPAGLLKAAEYFERIGDRPNAQRVIRALLQNYPASDVALAARLKAAELALAERAFESARLECQRVLAATKDAAERVRAQLLMAQALSGLGRYSEAESTLNEVVRTARNTPGYFEALYRLGSLKRQLGDVQEALASWRLLADDTARAPASLRLSVLLDMGDAYVSSGDYGRALAHFERAAPIPGAQAGVVLLKAAMAAEQAGQKTKASDYYFRAYQDTSAGTNRRALLAGATKSALLRENYPEVIRLAERFRDEFRGDRMVPVLLLEAAAVAMHRLNDPRRAADLYQDVLGGYPDHPAADDALFGYASALAKNGSFDDALRAFQSLERRFPATPHLSSARQEMKRIELFDLKSRDAGLEKLSLLIGDVIAQRSRADLAFRLAEIYFHELKDYEQAATQYTHALQSGLEEAKRPAAWYSKALSYERLAWRESLRDGARRGIYAAQALAAYDSLLAKYGLSEFSERATVSAAVLRVQLATSVSELRGIASSFLKDHPTLRGREAVLMAMGDQFRRFHGDEDAALMYDMIVQRYPQSPLVAGALYALAEALTATGKVDSAAILLQQYLAKYPNGEQSAEGAWRLGEYHAERGRLSHAEQFYERIEREYAYAVSSERLDRARAAAAFKAGAFATAIRFSERFLREWSEDIWHVRDIPAEVLFMLAQSYERVGNRSEAKRYYAEYLARDASTARAGEVYFALAGIAREEKNLDLATRYLQEAGRLTAGRAGNQQRAALEAGELFFRNERYNEAVLRFNEVAQQTTVDSVKQHALARVVVSYFRMNNLAEADARATAFLRQFPNAREQAAEFEFERGRYHLRRNEFDRARAVLEAIPRRYSNTSVVPDAQYWLGRVTESAGRTQEAMRVYEQIIAQFPSNPIAARARLSLGNLYYTLEQWDPAARHYKAILDNEQLAPDLVPFAMSNLIMAYKELNLFDGALELTRKYIERFPDDPELINKRVDIGVLYQRLGYYDQSILHLQTLLENADADLEAELRYYIGEGYYYKGEFQQAILEFLKVPYLVTRKTRIDWVATSYYMAGQAYEKMSRFEQAITMYRQIIERPDIDGQFKTAAQKEIDRVNALVNSRK